MTVIYGTIVDDAVYKGVIEFGTKITKTYPCESSPPHARVYSDDYLIFPGFIDINTHCREDTSGVETHKECYQTAGMAALNGGVTYIADMPDNHIPTVDAETYAAKQELAKKCPIDVLLYAGIGPKTSPFSKHVPYNVYMGPNVGNLFFRDQHELDVALERYRNMSVSFHCECPVMLNRCKNESKHEARRPQICETDAINFAIGLISKYRLQGKICQVSTVASLNSIDSIRRSGVHVYAEITPHHLFFNLDMIKPENRPFLQTNPPLRTKADAEALLQALRRGEFEFLASGHAPHTVAEKMTNVSGIPHLDTYGGFVSWLISAGNVDPIRIFRMCCMLPGQWINQFTGRKIGRILPDYEASITILNMTKSVADSRGLYTRCNWSPFDLRKLPGSVETVYLKGEKVVDGAYMKNF